MKLHKIMVGIGIALILFIPVWLMFVVPELEKLDEDYEYETNLFGTENVFNTEIGDYEGEEVVKVYRKVSTLDVNNNEQIINDFFQNSFLNGEVYYKTNQEFTVNRKTRKIEGTEAFFEFPRNVEKKDYLIWFYYLTQPFKVNFEKEEIVSGLGTYIFTYELDFDATSGFSDSDELVPETYYVRESPIGKIWVEPVTGIIVKLEDSGIDHYVEKTDNVLTALEIFPTFKWTARYNDDTIANQVRFAQNEKQKIILFDWIVPVLLGLIGIALIFSSFIGRRLMGYGELKISKPVKPLRPIIPDKNEK